MIGNQALRLAIQEGRLAEANRNPVDGIINIGVGNRSLVTPRGEDCRFVQQVGQISTGKTGRPSGNQFEVDILGQLFVAGVNLENFVATLEARPIYGHLAIKTTRTQQGRIKDIRPVGSGDDNNTCVALKAIHFGQQLIEGLFTLIVTATNTSTPLTTNSINFINKNNAWGVIFGLFEQIADAGSANTDEHFHKF